MSEPIALRAERDATIDVLRGAAIGLVLLLHFSLTYRLPASPLGDLFGAGAVRAVTRNGNYGVTIFFVVSGFLITSNALRRYGSLAAIDIRAFYVQRAARILPPLLLALAVIVLLGLAGVPSSASSVGGQPLPAWHFLVAVASVLTFTHNLLMQSVGYFNYCFNIYWSLSVEEMFYLAFPLLCVAARRQALVVALCALAIAVGPLYRSMHADDELFFMYGYAACFDAIAFGCLAALAAAARPAPGGLAASGVAGSSLALVSAYLAGIAGHEMLGFTAIAASTAGLLYFNAARPPSRSAPSRWLALLRWAGRHSYELYLFHIVVLAAMRDLVPRNQLGYGWKLAWLAAYLVLSALTAQAVARWLAEPANAAIRKRYFAARIGPAMHA